MRISEKVGGKAPLQTGGTARELAVTIENSMQTVNTLCAQVYSNPELAVVRELCSNATDAHCRCGKNDVPFQVWLPEVDGSEEVDAKDVRGASLSQLGFEAPTTGPEEFLDFGSCFVVKDFGDGMSDVEVRGEFVCQGCGHRADADADDVCVKCNSVMRFEAGVYAILSASSKRKESDAVGCLGIGSKSPLAISPDFYVISADGETQRMYRVGQGATSPLVVQMMGYPHETTHRGTTVIVPIAESKRLKIWREVVSTLYWYGHPHSPYRVRPSVVNAEGKIEIAVEGWLHGTKHVSRTQTYVPKSQQQEVVTRWTRILAKDGVGEIAVRPSGALTLGEANGSTVSLPPGVRLVCGGVSYTYGSAMDSRIIAFVPLDGLADGSCVVTPLAGRETVQQTDELTAYIAAVQHNLKEHWEKIYAETQVAGSYSPWKAIQVAERNPFLADFWSTFNPRIGSTAEKCPRAYLTVYTRNVDREFHVYAYNTAWRREPTAHVSPSTPVYWMRDANDLKYVAHETGDNVVFPSQVLCPIRGQAFSRAAMESWLQTTGTIADAKEYTPSAAAIEAWKEDRRLTAKSNNSSKSAQTTNAKILRMTAWSGRRILDTLNRVKKAVYDGYYDVPDVMQERVRANLMPEDGVTTAYADLPENGVYVYATAAAGPRDAKNKAVLGKRADLQRALALVHQCCGVDNIYFVPKPLEKALAERPGWRSLYDVVTELTRHRAVYVERTTALLESRINDLYVRAVEDAITEETYWRQLHPKSVLQKYRELRQQDVSTRIPPFPDKWTDTAERWSRLAGRIEWVARHLGIEMPPQGERYKKTQLGVLPPKLRNPFLGVESEILAQYPLLSYIDHCGRGGSKETARKSKAIRDYIHLCDIATHGKPRRSKRKK